MKLQTSDDGTIHVFLSTRNLKALLLKLERPDSKRTLACEAGDGVLIVTAESDEDHYQGRPPGEMHPIEEQKLKDAA